MLEEEGFYSFWNAYPKKRSKGAAFKAWRATKSMRPPTPDVLKALAVLKASEDWQKEGGKWIPYPATWLNAWGWEDVPAVDLKDVLPNGKCWWQTVSGIESKAKELGLREWSGFHEGEQETFQAYAKWVRAIAESGKVVPMVRAA